MPIRAKMAHHFMLYCDTVCLLKSYPNVPGSDALLRELLNRQAGISLHSWTRARVKFLQSSIEGVGLQGKIQNASSTF